MQTDVQRPRIETKHPEDRGWHPVVVLTLEASAEPLTLCGYSWCDGRCGLPAGVFPDLGDGEFKMYSSMTAYGPVMQRFRLPWLGSRFEIPEKFRADLLERYWH